MGHTALNKKKKKKKKKRKKKKKKKREKNGPYSFDVLISNMILH